MTKRQLRILYLETNVALGLWGEKHAASLLRQHNHTARVYVRAGYDIKAKNRQTGQVSRVEVKTARKGKDNKWRFTLEKSGRYGSTSASAYSDYVVLLAVDCSTTTVFVIPTKDLNGKRQIAITSNPQTYSGRYATYRENWISLNGTN